MSVYTREVNILNYNVCDKKIFVELCIFCKNVRKTHKMDKNKHCHNLDTHRTHD